MLNACAHISALISDRICQFMQHILPTCNMVEEQRREYEIRQ
ncbi:MAG: hypothetical protein ACOX5R_06390 [bacterium]|jgi:hypothetical protein